MTQAALASLEAQDPLASDSQRLFAIGGILLVASGMLFGDIFAMFVLHPNNARIGEAMYAAAQLIPAGDVEGILGQFMAIGGFLENRGTKVDTHTHIIHMGYIGLLLAMLQPWVALSATLKRRVAWLFIVSSILLPVSIFSIYYVGLAYSPWELLGWGNVLADFFGALLAVALFIQLWGLWRHGRGQVDAQLRPSYIGADNGAARILLVGGLLLLVSGFFYGAGYAAWTQSGAAGSEVDILRDIVTHAAGSEQALLDADFGAFGQYQMYRAINIAVHTHINEMGILLLLMSFVQGFIHYSQRTRSRWARLAVISAFGLPLGILLEINFGIIGSILADFFGFTMIVSLMAMLFGLLRHTGVRDAAKGDLVMTAAQRILILTGIALIACTMAFGVAYALFDEHQTLVGMGMQMATGFMEASRGDMEAAYTALESYGAISQEYRNEVHSHGHWGMLSLILIVLALAYDRLALSDKQGLLLAWLLALSAILFPLGVLMQIGPAAGIGKVFSVAGSMGMVFGLLAAVYGLLKARPN